MKIETINGDRVEISRVFLAGPMRGRYEYNFPAFFEAALDLRSRGLDVHNPAQVDEQRGFLWLWVEAADANTLPGWAVASCEQAINEVDAVVVLPDWHRSEGVAREIAQADRLGLPVLSYPSLVPISPVERQLAGIDPAKPRPKLFIVGHGEHGKDTVGELIAAKTGLRLCDSSRFATSRAVRPYLETVYGIKYASDEECYKARRRMRPQWFEAIRHYNAKDPARLARELFTEADIYCGIRSRVEFFAARDLVDLAVWVDGSKRKPGETPLSFDITASDCDIVVDNNSSEAELERRVERFSRLLRYHLAS